MLRRYEIGITRQLIPTNERCKIVDPSINWYQKSGFATPTRYGMPVTRKENQNTIVRSNNFCVGVSQKALQDTFARCFGIKEQLDVRFRKRKLFNQRLRDRCCIIARVDQWANMLIRINANN